MLELSNSQASVIAIITQFLISKIESIDASQTQAFIYRWMSYNTIVPSVNGQTRAPIVMPLSSILVDIANCQW